MRAQPYGVLIIHGFASSLDSVKEIKVPLESMGILTRIPTLRGHGQKSPEALRGVHWHDWVADAEVALQSLLAEVERVIIVGHSMGGLIALTLAADHEDSVDSIVLAAAAVQLASPLAHGRPLHFLVPLILRLFTKWPLPPIYADRELAKYDTNYHWAPMDSITSFLEFAEVTSCRLQEVKVPTFIIQSRKDTTVLPKSAEIIYNSISTPVEQKRIMWLELTDHEMFRDCEKNIIVGAIENYVRERSKQ